MRKVMRLFLLLSFLLLGCDESTIPNPNFLIEENEEVIGIKFAAEPMSSNLPDPEWTMNIRIDKGGERSWNWIELLVLAETLSELAYIAMDEPQCMMATKIEMNSNSFEVEFGAWSSHFHANPRFHYSVYEAGFSVLRPLAWANEILSQRRDPSELIQWNLEQFRYNYREGGILIYEKKPFDGSGPEGPGPFFF